MEQQTLWRFEVNNPLTSTEWRPLWEVYEDQLVPSQELRDELNIINAPVQLRIVRSSHSNSCEVTKETSLRSPVRPHKLVDITVMSLRRSKA